MKHKPQLASLLLTAVAAITFSCQQQPKIETAKSSDATAFKGEIKLDVRDSKADLTPIII